MRKVVLVLVLSSLAVAANAESKIKAEVIVEKTEHKVTFLSSSGNGQSDVFDDSRNGLGLRFSYSLNSYFSAEVAYHDYGRAEFLPPSTYIFMSEAQVHIKSINYGIKGLLPISERLSLAARIGIAQWDMTEKTLRFKNGFPPNKSGSDTYYSLGLEYELSENISIGLEYSVLSMQWSGERHGGDNTDLLGLIDTESNDLGSVVYKDINSDSTEYDIESFSISFGYSF